MSMMQSDWFLKQIYLLEESLKTLAEKKLLGQQHEVLEDLQAIASDLFGPELDLIAAMDSRSAADMLGEPEKVEFYARYLTEIASLREQLGQSEQAAEDRARALELLDERKQMPGKLRPETLDLLRHIGQNAD